MKQIAPSDGTNEHWPATSEPSDPFYWAREAIAYETGFFGDERYGVRAARCYLVDRRDNAARRERLYAEAEALVRAPTPYLEDEGLREHGAAVRRLWDQRDRVFAFCAALPHPRCHNDFWPPNLFALREPAQTVAIDLAYAGLGPLGHDAANLVADAVMDFFVPADDAHQLWEAVAAAYRRGLSGTLSEQTARAAGDAMLLTAALKFAWLIPAAFQVVNTPEGVARIAQRYGNPERFFSKRSAALRFVGTLIEQSLRLLDAIG